MLYCLGYNCCILFVAMEASLEEAKQRKLAAEQQKLQEPEEDKQTVDVLSDTEHETVSILDQFCCTYILL